MELINADCWDAMFDMEDNSVDAIVTDPPYGLSFMGKKWDYDVPAVIIWKEAIRVLKPGGYILCACGTRTQHRMTVNIEDAGFEIRDVISWIYGSGFPKSLDVSKAIDNKFGAEREVIGDGKWNARKVNGSLSDSSVGLTTKADFKETAPSTDEAKQYSGWGTALKPAQELWTLARKPLSEKTVAENVLKHGTGGINIDACRIDTGNEIINEVVDYSAKGIPHAENDGGRDWINERIKNGEPVKHYIPNTQGRFPANVIFDEFMGEELDKQTGVLTSGNYSGKRNEPKTKNAFGEFAMKDEKPVAGSSGGASRFFYCAKASKSERNAGLEELEYTPIGENTGNNHNVATLGRETQYKNSHPTVKPIKLMEYLIKLITPIDGIVLDPFMGSGTTGVAAKNLDRKFIGIERDPNYFKICQGRIL